MMRSTSIKAVLVTTLLLIHIVLLAGSSSGKSPTSDEFGHYAFGASFMEKGIVDQAKAQRMPVSILNALPDCGVSEGENRTLNDKRFLFVCRTPTMLASTILCLMVFVWSRLLYGWRGGLFSLAICVFSPTIIAHGRLITTDTYATLAVVLACFTFWQLCRAPTTTAVLLSATTLGIAQGTKFSAVILLPTFLILLALSESRRGIIAALRQNPRKRFWLLLFPFTAICALGAAYGFSGLFTPLSEFTFYSDFFRSAQRELPGLSLPFPRAYVEGLDILRYMSTTPGSQRGPNYLLGHLSRDGWWYYYLVVGLFKIPLGYLAILALRAAGKLRAGAFGFRQGEVGRPVDSWAFLVLPALVWFAFFSFFSTVQIGIRHVLPAMALAYVYAGGLIGSRVSGETRLAGAGNRAALIPWLLLASGIVSSLAVFPDYISYTNELMVPRRNAYRIMADSNLDWGQDRWYLREYLEQHPDAVANPLKPTTGHIIVRINNLVGIFKGPRYRWLLEGHEPAEVFHGSHLIFHLDQEPGS
jgi:hypothetical protein